MMIGISNWKFFAGDKHSATCLNSDSVRLVFNDCKFMKSHHSSPALRRIYSRTSFVEKKTTLAFSCCGSLKHPGKDSLKKTDLLLWHFTSCLRSDTWTRNKRSIPCDPLKHSCCVLIERDAEEDLPQKDQDFRCLRVRNVYKYVWRIRFPKRVDEMQISN